VERRYSAGAFSIGSNRSASSPSRFHDLQHVRRPAARWRRSRAARMRNHDPARQQMQAVPKSRRQLPVFLLKYLGSPTMA